MFGPETNLVVGQNNTSTSSDFGEIPANWLNMYSAEVDAQVERFGVAYSLSPEALASLRELLVSRIVEQRQFEISGFQSVQQRFDAAIANGVDLSQDNEESRVILRNFALIAEQGPLNDLVVAKELEATLEPLAAAEGRARLVDLIARRDQEVLARDDDFELQSTHNANVAEARIAAEAPLSPAGNPLPRGEKLVKVAPESIGVVGGESAASLPIKPNAAAVPMLNDVGAAAKTTAAAQEAERADLNEVKAAADALLADPTKTVADVKGARPNGRTAKAAAAKAGREGRAAPASPNTQPPVDLRGDKNLAEVRPGPSRPMPAAVEPVRLQAAPPIDDWDKYVDTTCKKFAFTEAQVIKAQSILKDLRNRAAAYRTGRADDFAAAERIADAKTKADRKKELSAPIDAFFEELKQRLDNLATLEQRAKAAAAAPGKK